jgi:CubicO group peptidase (beta-lactamase class C family)
MLETLPSVQSKPIGRYLTPDRLTEDVHGILNRHPAVGLALGVVNKDRLEFFYGHGVADVATGRPITADTVFRVASISKTFTAIAVMQLWERGLVDLDAPAPQYLKSVTLSPVNPLFGPATVRHLLTHTAGVPENVGHVGSLSRGWFAESVALDEPIPSLADYYRGGIRLTTEPGTNFKYTNHGYAILGQIVEDVSGASLDRYMRTEIFEPLGMDSTDLTRTSATETKLAGGYVIKPRGPRRITDRHWVTAAASSVYSTPADMGRYLSGLLGGGTNDVGSVLEPSTVATMFAAHYRPDPRLPGMGLGFFRVDLGGHPAVEHQGILPGFNSQIFLAPADGFATMAFTNGSRQAMFWLPVELSTLLGRIVGAAEARIRSDIPMRPDVWADLCGYYSVPALATDIRLRAMMGVGAQVFVRKGRLYVRVLTAVPSMYRGFELHPDDVDDPLSFRIDLSSYGLGTARIVFRKGTSGEPASMSMDLMPLSFRRRPRS